MYSKLLAIVGLVLVMLTPAYADISIGDKAPEFTLTSADGKKVSLSDYKDKVVVLEWTNPDCPFVKRHYSEKTFNKLRSMTKSLGMEWFIVNSTHYMTPEQNSDWAESVEVDTPVLVDQDGKVGHAYSAKTTPHMFIIDKGVLVYQGGVDDDPQGEMAPEKRRAYLRDAILDLKEGRAVAVPETKPYGCSVKYK